jgi:L-threonylcarbamoyladenylate synthase
MVEILPITDAAIARAAELLRNGALVAFPTETVYGLGGDATDDAAVAAIFAAKNRPDFNPLIVHLASAADASEYGELNATAERLAERFWPGALTLVVRRRADCRISLLASAGLDTLALRVPGHDAARRLIEAAGCPIAAPSANASGRLSPTEAEHVAASLGDKVALILDGGPCRIGVESTVLDVTGDMPCLLRPGGIAVEEIEEALGSTVALPAPGDDTAPRSPGMLAAHYAPKRPLRMNAENRRPGEAVLGFGPGFDAAELNLSPAGDTTEAAANLFASLHQLDRPPFTGIAVAPIPETGLGRAINDRLRRAAAS